MDFDARHAGDAGVGYSRQDDTGYLERRQEIIRKLAASVTSGQNAPPYSGTSSSTPLAMGPPPPPSPPPPPPPSPVSPQPPA